MLSTSVPIRREASQGETTTGAADIQGEVVPPQMGPPEHLHVRSDAGFLVVKRRHTGKDDRGLALVDDRSTAWHRELAHLKSVFCTQAKNICHTKKQVHEHGLTSLYPPVSWSVASHGTRSIISLRQHAPSSSFSWRRVPIEHRKHSSGKRWKEARSCSSDGSTGLH